MFDIIQLTYFTAPIAFVLTYLLHSTVWILLMLCLVKLPALNTPLLKNYLWKGALIGGLCTSLIIHFSGNSLLEIHLGQESSLTTESIQQPNDCKQIPEATKNIIIPIKEDQQIEKEELIVDATPIENSIENAAEYTPIIPVKVASETQATSFKIMPFILTISFVFWILGALFLLLKETIRHFVFIKKIGDRTTTNHPTVLYALNKIRLKLKQTLQITLSQSTILESPILIQNQEICLPEKAIDKLNKEQMEAMLAHEIAHIVRKDYYWNCFLVGLDTIFFFQPLHRIAIKEIQTTNELLCDEWAAKVIGNNLALAQCLLTVATWMKSPTKTYPLVAGMSLKKSELSDRITSLINLPDMKKQRFNTLKVGLPFIALLAMAIFVLPGFTFTNLADTIPFAKAPTAITKTESATVAEPKDEPKNEPINKHEIEPVEAPTSAKIKEPIEKQLAKESKFNTIGWRELPKESEFSTIGWGSLEDKVNERTRERYLQYDLSTNLEINKFLPEKWRLKIPFYAQHTATTYTPEYDPYDLDIPLKEKLTSTEKELEAITITAKNTPISDLTTIKEIVKTPAILLEEKFEVNKKHKYFNTFHTLKGGDEAEGKKYIKSIYYLNLSCAGSTRNNIGGPLVTNKGDKNSLIFTLDYGDRIEYDTLQNCVHPPSDNDGYEYKVKGWLPNFIGKQIYKATDNDIRGHHPAVVEMTWVEQSDNQKQTPIGIKLRGAATIKIEISTTKGQHLSTIADGTFEKGKHEFIFPHVNIKKGTYRLVISVDGETVSQNIRVKRTRLTTNKEKNSCATLLRAVKGNNIQQVKALIQTTDPNCEYREEGEPRSPLNAAARKGNIEIGKLLLAANADVAFRARGDEGALMGAARHGHLDFVKLMVENGAKVNKTVSGDGTALINAVRGGHYEIAEYLLENGADPMLSVSGDENPITHAVNQGDKMLDLLLKYRKQTK